MADSREAILNGAKAAHTLHRDLGLREPLERAGGGRVDVFAAITKLGATLMFQPLDKLLGAYLPDEEPGVLITTKRTLPVQRFTGAHELAHLYMRHQPSVDDDGILRRPPFSTSTRLQRQEREADAFASMFLAPAWLLALIANARPIFRRQSATLATCIVAIVAALDRDVPVLFTMSVSRAFFLPAADGVVSSSEPLEPKRVHALVAVGHGRRNTSRLILARNSWGEGWGLAGYAWLDADYLQPRLLAAARMTSEI